MELMHTRIQMQRAVHCQQQSPTTYKQQTMQWKYYSLNYTVSGNKKMKLLQ